MAAGATKSNACSYITGWGAHGEQQVRSSLHAIGKESTYLVAGTHATVGRAQADGSASSLYQLLARVAPPAGGRPAEVLIAISNYNLIGGGQLTAWLEARSKHLLESQDELGWSRVCWSLCVLRSTPGMPQCDDDVSARLYMRDRGLWVRSSLYIIHFSCTVCDVCR